MEYENRYERAITISVNGERSEMILSADGESCSIFSGDLPTAKFKSLVLAIQVWPPLGASTYTIGPGEFRRQGVLIYYKTDGTVSFCEHNSQDIDLDANIEQRT